MRSLVGKSLDPHFNVHVGATFQADLSLASSETWTVRPLRDFEARLRTTLRAEAEVVVVAANWVLR